MIFVSDHTQLKIVPTEQSVAYTQKINSEIFCKDRRQEQSLEKQICVGITSCEGDFFNVSIHTKKLKLQLDSVLKKQEDLSTEISTVIDMIQFSMNHQGKLFSILNHEEIVHKWYGIKENLCKYYKGQATERYLIGLEKKILNHDKLLNDCEQYRLYGLLFNEMYNGTYTNDGVEGAVRERDLQNAVYQLPLVINEKVLFQAENDIEILLRIDGKLNPEQPYYSKINNLFTRKNIQSIQGIKLDQYEGSYKYHKKNSFLNKIDLNIATSYGQEYYKKQQYSIKRETE